MLSRSSLYKPPIISLCRNFATLRQRGKRISTSELYEPKFEKSRIYPDYAPINVRMQAYDFVPLEKFQAYLYKMAKRFKFSVDETFACSHRSERVRIFKPNTSVVQEELELKLYDRWIRLSDIPSVRLPLFILLVRAHTPPGVKITIKEHEKSDYSDRYIPDLELKRVQEELRSLDNPQTRRMLGWE